jgi:hypothetical protein
VLDDIGTPHTFETMVAAVDWAKNADHRHPYQRRRLTGPTVAPFGLPSVVSTSGYDIGTGGSA